MILMSAINLTDAPFDKVRFLVGGSSIEDAPLTPYDDDVCEFLADLSSHLMKVSAVRGFPDVVSFAYWCRKANIQGLKAQTGTDRFPLSCRLGRGVAFHVAPSNIPVNFAFSFVFGLLAGNANIVRVPSKPFEQTTLICDSINAVLPGFPEVASRVALVTYPASDDITGAFCALSDVRVIWGGDRTIESIKAFQAHPRCKDITFSDRYSIALINGEAVQEASDDELVKLADRFYNDTYLMDQNACSSPQMMFWSNATAADKDRFWKFVGECARRRYELQPEVVMDKYVQLCEDAIDGRITEPASFNGLITLMPIDSLPKEISGLRGKGGYFYEHDVRSLSEVIPHVTERYQTLLYYGYDAEDLRRLVVSAHLRGIDRIVPFGSAMDIDVFWDGYDLITEMSRIVDAR